MTRETDAGPEAVRPPREDAPKRARTAKTKLDGIVAVCGKCGRRQGLGRRALCRLVGKGARRLRDRGAAEGGTDRALRLRVVETGCLGPCPKRALAMATGPGLARGRVLLVDPEAGPAEIARLLRQEFALQFALQSAPPISAPLPD